MLACIGLAIEDEMCFKLMLSCGKTTNQMRLLLKTTSSILLPQDLVPIVMSSCHVYCPTVLPLVGVNVVV